MINPNPMEAPMYDYDERDAQDADVQALAYSLATGYTVRP